MWICPKCGREFKRTNQGHYCGKAPVVFHVLMNEYYGVCRIMKKKENAIYFSYNKTLPTKLITDIVKWCLS